MIIYNGYISHKINKIIVDDDEKQLKNDYDY